MDIPAALLDDSLSLRGKGLYTLILALDLKTVQEVLRFQTFGVDSEEIIRETFDELVRTNYIKLNEYHSSEIDVVV